MATRIVAIHVNETACGRQAGDTVGDYSQALYSE
jgi:hypothetical protein